MREFTKIKKESPRLNLQKSIIGRNKYIITIGEYYELFDMEEVNDILINKIKCVEHSGKVRLDILESKIIYFVNELVKLTQIYRE